MILEKANTSVYMHIDELKNCPTCDTLCSHYKEFKADSKFKVLLLNDVVDISIKKTFDSLQEAVATGLRVAEELGLDIFRVSTDFSSDHKIEEIEGMDRFFGKV